jgi:phage protein D
MSDIENARRVKVHVSIGGHDATSFLEPYLLDFTYTDNATGKADEVQLTLHDRDGKWQRQWKPKKGMPVTASIVCYDWFSGGESVSLPCGAFKIDEIEFSGPPDKITIKAVTSALTTGLRDELKTRAWENVSVRVVAGQVASEHGLALMYDGDSHDFRRMDQRDESDLAFLDRIARERGMHCKVHDGKLVIRDAEGAYAQGAQITVKKSGDRFSPKKWSFKQASSKTAYGKAEVTYTDPNEGTTHKATVQAISDGGGEPDAKILELIARAENAGQAMALGKGALQDSNSKKNTSTIETMGHPGIVAGITVNLSGFGDFSGSYFVNKAEHKVSGGGGYTTSFEVSRGKASNDDTFKEDDLESGEGEDV